MLGEEERIAMFAEVFLVGRPIRDFERVVECRRGVESAHEWYGV